MSTTPGIKNNIGNFYTNSDSTTPLAGDSTTFAIVDPESIVVTKTTNSSTYVSNDQIIFTIIITNNGTIPLTDLIFKDTIDSSVIPQSGTNYTVTTTSGTVSSNTSPIIVTGITVPSSSSVTITIEGKIDTLS